MLRFLTAGESHGQALEIIVEGLPAGLAITVEQIADELARRRLGYGRGPRMRFERDEVDLVAGVRHGRTLGSPVGVRVANTEWPKWEVEMAAAPGAPSKILTQPRPGHADLAGMLKYGFADARDVLERASARETVARVVAGRLAKALLDALGVTVISHVTALGGALARVDIRPGPDDLDAVDASEVRCFDANLAEAMVREIKAAAKVGDSLGGIAEVIAYGVPVGLGSHVHFDRKLDGMIAQAVMSIHAVKGVEIGEAFTVVHQRGSEAHDAVRWNALMGAYERDTNRAGGIEGGISNGEPIVVRAAMKPLATLNRPVLATVDVATKQAALSFRERTDVTAVPAMGVVAETMVSLVLAREAQRKFGGDSLAELVRNRDGYLDSLGETPSAVTPIESGSGDGWFGGERVKRAANHVLLIGMMGSGKTTVGRRLADLLGRPFFDSDAQVERATGRSVPQIFATVGEQAFRDEETKALRAAVQSATSAVIVVAGGAVLAAENRELLSHAGQIVWLRAEPTTLAWRIGDGRGRPLLDGDPVVRRLVRLDAERRPLYAQLAARIVDVDDSAPAPILQQVLHALQRRVPVELGARSYEVAVGPGSRLLLDEVLPTMARRAVIVTQQSIDISLEPGIESRTVCIPEGEAAKSLAVIEQLCRAFAQFGLTRADVVIGLGGGVVTDVAGFAAASYHRGVAVVHVPTTLLAQVDAAIGGKTGVNLPEGKNLVGAFHQPAAVLCDVDLLATLPEREWRSGQGEMAKYAFLGVDDLDRLPLVEQVARCVAKKAEVVSSDERESGRRATLNYGHTLAHALEAAGFAESSSPGVIDLRHGEAVAIGLVFAARLAALLGRIDDQRVERHLDVVRSYDLPTEIPSGVPLGELVEIMGRDKKATDGLTFVLDGPNGVETVAGVSASTVNEALGASVPGARRAS